MYSIQYIVYSGVCSIQNLVYRIPLSGGGGWLGGVGAGGVGGFGLGVRSSI